MRIFLDIESVAAEILSIATRIARALRLAVSRLIIAPTTMSMTTMKTEVDTIISISENPFDTLRKEARFLGFKYVFKVERKMFIAFFIVIIAQKPVRSPTLRPCAYNPLQRQDISRRATRSHN